LGEATRYCRGEYIVMESFKAAITTIWSTPRGCFSCNSALGYWTIQKNFHGELIGPVWDIILQLWG